MATYVNNLRLKEITTGDESGTWGTSTNLNLELIGQALGYGTEAITTNADTHATTIADGAADEGRALFLKYTGTLDSACTITLGPNTVKKVWIIENATSGSQNIIISQGSGANITIAPGKNATIYTDGAGSGAAVLDAFADLELSSSLSVAGATTLTGVTTHGGNVVSDTDSTDDLGTTGVRWANLYVDDVVATTTVKPGTLVLAAGSITDTSGAITFGNENLVTTGTFGAAATTLSSTLAVAGNLTVSGAGPHAIGAAVVNYAGFYLGASFTSLGASTVAAGTLIGQTLTNHSGDTTYSSSVVMNGIQTNMVTGTIADISQLRIDEPGITNTGGGTITNASSLHITGAPTEGAANWAILVDAGAVSLGGTLAVTGTSAFSADMVVSAAGAHRTITVGDGSSGSYSGMILRAANTQKAWKIVASQTISNGLEFIPGTSAGNTTFTTPTMSMVAAGVSVTGTLATTGAATLSSTLSVGAQATLTPTDAAAFTGYGINYGGGLVAGIDIKPNTGEVRMGGFSTSDYYPVIYSDGVAALSFGLGAAPAATFAGALTVTGTSTFTGALTAAGGLKVGLNDSLNSSTNRIQFLSASSTLRAQIQANRVALGDLWVLTQNNQPFTVNTGSGLITLDGATSAGSTLAVTGILSVDDTTQTSSGTTGSIHTDGGLGVAKDLFVLGNIAVAATSGVYFDGGNNTYIKENSADVLRCVSGGSGGVDLTSGATSWTAVSDERAKNLGEPIIDAMAKLGTLRTMFGTFKDDHQEIRHPFLIAQDVLAVYPEAVVMPEEEDLYRLSYTDMIPLMISGMNETGGRVETIEQKVERLTARIDELEATA